MQTQADVEHLDVREGGGLHGVPGGEALPEDPLVLEGVEPALGRGIVPAIALAAHRADYAVLGQLGMEHLTRVLAPPIGMVVQPQSRLVSKPTHGQRVADQIGLMRGYSDQPPTSQLNRSSAMA